ncbi:MAG: SDR family oxidoreductase [Actinomycetota bacterium]|nr:SDR family oxidoreductase [Actinomycetota bacterium]MDA2972808.1 SDR family oxidoreductase [Actinomycetota bacterium]MDA3000616.1 SDR family oxidoreductase [Actinomycetota bacterium]
MDLGLAGRRAIVCASSRGLGFACASALAREGADVIINGRNVDTLESARIRIIDQFNVRVTAVPGDITNSSTQEALVSACPEPDILVNNNGGPTPGSFAEWDRDAWIAALDSNMLAPLALVRLVLPGMVERKFGRIINITSAMVKTPMSPMGLSTGARAGLTSVVKALSKDVAHANVTINNILPERIDTERQHEMARLHSQLADISIDEAYERMANSIAARRLGRPEEVGDACAFLCSAQAGYISGQNLQLDGGSYSGMM